MMMKNLKGLAVILFCSVLLAFSADKGKSSFRLVLLPDTQNYTLKYNNIFNAQTLWIAEHSKDIAFVLQQGDITNNNTEEQWKAASSSFELMDGKVPYTFVPGNHDTGAGGKTVVRNTDFMNTFLPYNKYSRFSSFKGAFERGRMDNTWHTFNAGEYKWLILSLEFGPRNVVLDWAGKIIEKHPRHKVIINTHAYLYSDDKRMGEAKNHKWLPQECGIGKETGPNEVNNGVQMWDKLVKVYPNIMFVFCGHVLNDGTGLLISEGQNGNKVIQMLANYQTGENGGNGYMRLIDIDPVNSEISVKTYSPYLDKYKTEPDQQFVISMKELKNIKVKISFLHSLIPSLLFLVMFYSSALAQERIQNKIDLSGTWQFAIDRLDNGISEEWFKRQLEDKVVLPGSMTSNGKGDEITLETPWTGSILDSSYFKNPEYAKFRQPGNIKVPFWLQPLKYYKGAAWYQKEVIIPESWKGKSIGLFLERCHWESRLWIDDKEAGMRNSLGTPHLYDLTGTLTPGKHQLTLCIDNRVKDIDPGLNSHSISDHSQTNWNGIVGKMYLEERPLINLENIQVYPNIHDKKFDAGIKVNNPSGQTVQAELKLTVTGDGFQKSKIEKVDLTTGENVLRMQFLMGSDVKLWSEFQSSVYKITAILKDEDSKDGDTLQTSFGMREFKVVGKQIQINGSPVFLRGTLECAIFPLTGYPSTEIKDWLRIFKICRAHGLNHMRFHSWCPPQAAFDAADQSGFYLQVECSSWGNRSTSIGDMKPIDKYLYEESKRMVETYGNHPSFCMMAYGNEPSGNNRIGYLTEFVNYWKGKDSRRIYTAGSGWPIIPESDYLSTPVPRIQHWGEELKSIINGQSPRSDYDWSKFNSGYPQPVVTHEIGDWCVYPNFREIPKYTGVLRARNFELFQETLNDHGMAQLADSFLLASGKLQALCYKADIEAVLRTPEFGGFQLLDLHDFPGQGTALVGVLDVFWDEKGYISPAEYKRFCNSTVPLARLKKCIFTNDENFDAEIEVAHYGDGAIADCKPEWKVMDSKGKVFQSGKFNKTNIRIGNAFKIGSLSLPLASISLAEKLKLEVSVNDYTNSWDFWVYPAKKAIVPGEQEIRLVQKLDEETNQYLQKGGSVLLNIKKGNLSKEMGGDVKIGFSSIFWNTAWTRGQAPNTLGILCNPKHPALADFPTEYHSNWQWWDAMSHSGTINLSSFSTVRPIVRVIDDWFTNRPLALIFEGKVGKGKILISGIDLTTDLEKRPEAAQLLHSLKKYMIGTKFNPVTELKVEQIARLTNFKN